MTTTMMIMIITMKNITINIDDIGDDNKDNDYKKRCTVDYYVM